MGPTSISPDEISSTKTDGAPSKIRFIWDTYHLYVHELKKQIKPTPEIIVSIGKGGSIPGVILAELYGVNNLNLGLSSYEKQNRNKIHEYQSIDSKHFDTLRDMNVLIVDDIADSGATMKYAVDKFKQNYCTKVTTATVFYKDCSVFKPDFYSEQIDKAVWIVQPWER